MPLSIIIVSYNTVDYLRECLNSVYQYAADAEVIVVDNASSDASCAMVKAEYSQVKLIASEQNLGFGVGNNLGVEHATQPYILLLNSDAVLKSDTAHQLLEYLQAHEDVACVGPRVVLPVSGEIQAKTFGFVPRLKNVLMQSLGLNRMFPKHMFFAGIDGDFRWAREMPVGWLSGVCMAMRTVDYVSVGGFDKRFFMYCEDIELCMKLQKIGKIMLVDDFDVMHYGGASSKSIASKVRNSVWQQRNLLAIVHRHSGIAAYTISRIFIALGLLSRLAFGLLTVPVKGTGNNLTLQSAYARLKDIFGINALKEIV